MKYISVLPEPYKSLAEKRREECMWPISDEIEDAFLFMETTEGYDFWADVSIAETEQELPPIPEES